MFQLPRRLPGETPPDEIGYENCPDLNDVNELLRFGTRKETRKEMCIDGENYCIWTLPYAEDAWYIVANTTRELWYETVGDIDWSVETIMSIASLKDPEDLKPRLRELQHDF